MLKHNKRETTKTITNDELQVFFKKEEKRKMKKKSCYETKRNPRRNLSSKESGEGKNRAYQSTR